MAAVDGITLGQLSGGAGALGKRQERALFSAIRMTGGIFKTTVAGRLRDVDAAMAALVPGGRELREILDVGVSSGTTSLEWLEALTAAGCEPRLTATDLSLKAYLIEPWPGYRVLLDGAGKPLRHLVRGVAIRPWRRRLDYVTQNWLVVGLANALFARATTRGAVSRAMPGAATVFLVEPQVAAHPAITLEEDDVFGANPPAHVGRYDAVRVANLLLPGVFGEARVRVGIANLKARLAGPGALFVVARTRDDGANHATIFTVDDDGQFAVRQRVGDGSEIEALILSI